VLCVNPEVSVADIASQMKVSRRTLFRELGPRPAGPQQS